MRKINESEAKGKKAHPFPVQHSNAHMWYNWGLLLEYEIQVKWL